jgi:6-phosphogluconolactonase
MKKIYLLTFLAFLSLMLLLSCSSEPTRLFVGGFTTRDPKGLSVYDFNQRNGELKLISHSDVGPSPSFFCYSGKKKLFYTLNEVMDFNGVFGGGLTTLKYDAKDGSFEKKNELLIPYGGPCYISMSPDSGFLFIANYPNGSVAVVKLDDNGIPATITDSLVYYRVAPRPSHAHMILNNPSGSKIYVTDLGLDRIMIYNFDRNSGKLNWAGADTVTVPTGSGPRHFTFNANGSKMYVINELGSKIMVFDVEENGGLKLLQTLSTFRPDFIENNYCAEIAIGKNGKFLYGSNRGENSIVTFSIGTDGLLTLAGHTSCGGDWPRSFVIDPSGKFLLVGNQKSDQVSVFKLNKNTGLPVEPAKQYSSKTPAYLKFF